MKIKKLVSSALPTQWGKFIIHAFELDDQAQPHLALVHEDCVPTEAVHVRIHSECMTGDLFGSSRCDCGPQLHKAFEICAAHQGIIIYLRQEGRGIGLVNKLKAYNEQDKGMNTADANLHLGFQIDERDYSIAIQMLEALHVSSIHLLTNNPDKIKAISDSPIDIISRVPLLIDANEDNKAYLQTKKDLMGHLLDK